MKPNMPPPSAERLTERLGDMAVFASVVGAGGFTAAARELGLSKGAVSKSVGRLESHLETRLLSRSTRRVVPTEAGLALLAYCRNVVEQADAAEQHLGHLRAVPQGTLRMTAPLSFGIACVAPLLPGLRQRHPSLDVVLTLEDAVVDLVGQRMDLALRAGPLPDSGLVARRIGRIRASVVASPAYLDRHGEPSSPDDLIRHACLRYGEHVRAWRFDGADQPIGAGMAVNSTLAQLQVALHGGGLALLSDYLTAPHLATGALRRVLEGHGPAHTEVYAVHPHLRHVPAHVAAAVAYFAEHLAAS